MSVSQNRTDHIWQYGAWNFQVGYKKITNVRLGFASPCIIIYSNESTNQVQTISQVHYLSFKYSSTCFRHLHAHHQELNNYCSRLCFTVGTWWYKCYCSCSGRPARPRTIALLPPRSNGKPEAATAVIELLMMSMKMPETCWAVFKRQVMNLRNCLHLIGWSIGIKTYTQNM
jgi:hypothetical protein